MNRNVQRILVTGSIGVQKSKILIGLAARGYSVLPEAATVLWQCGYPGKGDPDIRSSINTQIAVAQVQLSMEVATEAIGVAHICDHGILDNIAYTDAARNLGQESDLSDVESAVKLFCETLGVGWTLWDVYRRYDSIIFLELPPERDWRKDNPHIPEDYAGAKRMEEILLTIHAFHPNFRGIAGELSTFEKIQLVRRIVESECLVEGSLQGSERKVLIA